MWEDPIVAEVHRTRAELAERFDFDVNAIVADIRKRQSSLGARLVSLVKPVEPAAAPDRDGINGFSASTSELPARRVS